MFSQQKHLKLFRILVRRLSHCVTKKIYMHFTRNSENCSSSGTKKLVMCEISHAPPKSDFMVKPVFGRCMYMIIHKFAIFHLILKFGFSLESRKTHPLSSSLRTNVTENFLISNQCHFFNNIDCSLHHGKIY